jgi:protocatechuate 3,4-dioxygenase beta subunit
MRKVARRNTSVTLLVLLGTVCAVQGQADPSLVAGVVIDASNGTPIRKAYVSLSTAEDNPAQALAITDGAGRFAFANVPSGRYQLHTQRDGYQQAWYGAPTPNHAPGVIALHSGETRQDFVLRMTQLGAISGVVLDQDGDPLDGAMVSLWMPWFERGKPGFAQRGSTVTNDRGEYQIADVVPGRYLVMVNGTGRQAIRIHPESVASVQPTDQRFELQYGVQYFPATERLSGASLLTVAGKEIEGIDFHMVARAPTILRGLVVPAADVPPDVVIQVAGISLDVPDRAQFGFGTGAGPPKYEFETGGVLPGEYLLVATVSVGGRPYRGVQRAIVNAGAENQATLKLEPGIDLAGSLKIEGGSKEVEPLVVLTPGDALPYNNTPPQTHVKADGSFVIPGVVPGIWDIGVQPVPEGGYVKSMRLGEQDVLTEDMVIRPDTTEPLYIVVSTRGGILEGDVKTEPGKEAGPANVLAAPDGRYSHVLSFYTAVNSDEKGHFKLKGLTPGHYKLYAFETLEYCAWCDPDFLKPYASQGEPVQVIEDVNPPKEVRLIRNVRKQP